MVKNNILPLGAERRIEIKSVFASYFLKTDGQTDGRANKPNGEANSGWCHDISTRYLTLFECHRNHHNYLSDILKLKFKTKFISLGQTFPLKVHTRLNRPQKDFHCAMKQILMTFMIVPSWQHNSS